MFVVPLHRRQFPNVSSTHKPRKRRPILHQIQSAKMTGSLHTTFESLPNEIQVEIFSYLAPLCIVLPTWQIRPATSCPFSPRDLAESQENSSKVVSATGSTASMEIPPLARYLANCSLLLVSKSISRSFLRCIYTGTIFSLRVSYCEEKGHCKTPMKFLHAWRMYAIWTCKYTLGPAPQETWRATLCLRTKRLKSDLLPACERIRFLSVCLLVGAYEDLKVIEHNVGESLWTLLSDGARAYRTEAVYIDRDNPRLDGIQQKQQKQRQLWTCRRGASTKRYGDTVPWKSTTHLIREEFGLGGTIRNNDTWYPMVSIWIEIDGC